MQMNKHRRSIRAAFIKASGLSSTDATILLGAGVPIAEAWLLIG